MIVCAFCGTRCRPDGTRVCECRDLSRFERVLLDVATGRIDSARDFRSALRAAAAKAREAN